MFCDKCGTPVEEGQPFCPNCGNRLGEAADPAAAPRPAKAIPSAGGLLGKLNAKQGLEKIFFACIGGLLVVCFILSLLRVFSYGSYGSGPMAAGSPLFANVFTVLFTLCITFYVMDYFDKFTFKWLWLFLTCAAAVILLVFVIVWIDSGLKLSAGGWLFFICQIGLTAVCVLHLLEKMKK